MFPYFLSQRKDQPFPVEVAQFAFDTSTGNKDVTVDAAIGLGKTPIAAMFVTVLSSGFENAQARLGIGFFDGTSSVVLATDSDDSVTTTNTATRGASDECIMLINHAGTVLVEGAGVSLIPNGVRVNIGANIGVSLRGICFLFFDDDGAAKAGVYTSSATQDTSVTVTPGIATDAIISMFPRGGSDWFNDTAQTWSADPSIGFAVRGGGQCANDWDDRAGLTVTSITSYVSNNRGAVGVAGSTSIEYDNYTATQFDAITRGGTAGGTIGYLALEMPNAQFWTGVIDTPTATGKQAYTAPGFPALSVLSALNIVEAVNTIITDTTSECFGFGGGTVRGVSSASAMSEYGVSTSDTESYYSSSLIRAAGADSLGQVIANALIPVSGGFELNFTTVDTTAKKWPTLAIGRA